MGNIWVGDVVMCMRAPMVLLEENPSVLFSLALRSMDDNGGASKGGFSKFASIG
jgi:hypothetical protein